MSSEFTVMLENIQKTYGELEVLKGITAFVPKGQTIVLCGSSGSGKSTLIRLINRLEALSDGRIYFQGLNIHDGLINVNKLREKIGFVSQSFNLFHHLSARDNVSLALRKVKGMAKAEANELAMTQLQRLGLEHLHQRYPSQLSGGQQQRVAIARALAMSPELILFDEPTSALDPEMVGEVLHAMRRLAEEGMTMMCVTHEMHFARKAADRVWFLEQGRLLQDLPTEDFFAHNDNERVQRFLSSIQH